MENRTLECIRNEIICDDHIKNISMGDNCDYSSLNILTVGENGKLLENNDNIIGRDENVIFNSQEYSPIILENSKTNSNLISSKAKQPDETSIGGPFEYGSNYSYLFTKLKFILDQHDINEPLKNDLCSLLEVIGEMKVLGVYNEHYKKYRRAFDTYTLKLDPSSQITEDLIGELRYLSFQNSVSGRRELKLIDKIVKEWNKRDKEKRLLQSCRGAMSDWLNKTELGTNKNDNDCENVGDASKYILDSIKGSSNSFQQSSLLSFLPESYVSEKLYPYILNHLPTGLSGNQTPAFVGYSNKDQASLVCSSLSSIGEGPGTVGIACNQNSDGNNIKTCVLSNIDEISCDNLMANNKVTQNESVIDWIKNNFKRQLNNLECIDSEIQSGKYIHLDQLNNQSNKIEIVISSRLRNKKPVGIYDIISSHRNDLFADYYTKYLELYKNFLSIREGTMKKRSYYKSIPMIGSNRTKKQSVDYHEVRLRQYQTFYNDKNLPEIQSQIRRVLINRSEWKRPPMFLLLTHQGKECNGLNPIAKEEHINYDIDTDEEWEEQFGGEDVDDIDDGVENGDDDDDNEAVASGWLVPDGCFQSDELIDDVISSTGNCVDSNIVNLLSTSSRYQAPVVISFLNHSCIDFGAGISAPNDLIVKTLIDGYLIHFPQNLNWIYSRTCDDLDDEKRTSNELNDAYDQNEYKNSNNLIKKSFLDTSTKCELLYFVYGKYSPIKRIIDNFIELNLKKNMKRSSIIQFLKENIYKTRLNGDCKPRWYINNTSELVLDKDKLKELLIERNLDERIEPNNCKPSSKERSELKQEANQCANIKTQIETPNKRKYLEGNDEGSELGRFAVNVNKESKITSETENISNDENCAFDSQGGNIDKTLDKSTGLCLQNEQKTKVNCFANKDPDIKINRNKKRRKYSNVNRGLTPKDHDVFSINYEENKTQGQNENRFGTPDVKKNFTPIYNNSLITEFFQLKNKNN
ncbi:hypothetical protein RS030_81304 [Cryptosporidium xiaoi]|uniref:Chromatin assembly factor 1 subunit A dimerization domain-containing protein n=1 Tax=Cryptosporidium xiaoi TaxID=659607 RepID=A0AAV9XUR5_9CRYT